MEKESPRATRRSRIAVAGATGRVGSTLVSLLLSDAVDVVALTRDPVRARLPAGVTTAAVDFSKQETLLDALRGADRLFIAHGTSTQQVTNELRLIDSAVVAGVGNIVKLSVLGPPTQLLPYAWHAEIEAYLARQSIAATVLRPTVFADVLKRFADPIARGSWTGAAGSGRVNFIDTRDVASVARFALLEDVGPKSRRVYHLTGPRAWTMQEVAEELSRLLRSKVAYEHRSPREQRATLLAQGVTPAIADLLASLDEMFSESVHAETTGTVADLTGEAPRPLTAWLAENVAIFRQVKP